MHFITALILGLANSGELIQPTFSSPAAPPRLCRDPAVSRDFIHGARIAVDPLGRGVWAVDDENDEVLLVARPTRFTSGARVQRFRVGAWPEQVLPTPGGRTFVTARQAGVIGVIEPDGSTWSIPLGTEPRAMTLDLSTNRLFVGLVTALEVVSLDAQSGAVLRRRAHPTPPDFLAVSAAGLLVASRRSDAIDTLDLDLHHLGTRSAAIPAWRTLRGILGTVGWREFDPGPTESRFVGLTTRDDRVAFVVEEARPRAAAGTSAYGGGGAPIQRFLVEGALVAGGLLDDAVTPLPPSLVADLVLQHGRALVAFEGMAPAYSVGTFERPTRAAHLSATRWSAVDGTPGGVTVDDDGALVVLSRSHRSVSWSRVKAGVLRGLPGETGPDARVALPPSSLDPELRRGRALFFSFALAVTTAGMTCATCHPDGREDGRIWAQGLTLRQTPMLAERLRHTAPYNWLGTKPTLEANVDQTIRERLKGSGLGRADLSALTRYLLEGLRPVQRRPAASPTLVAEGRSLFHDEEVGCAGCHDSGRDFTDGERHDVESLLPRELAFAAQATGFGLGGLGSRPGHREPLSGRFDTPSLKHLALTPPYLHDGSAPSLRALIDDNHDRMGATSQLSARERDALIAYLETL